MWFLKITSIWGNYTSLGGLGLDSGGGPEAEGCGYREAKTVVFRPSVGGSEVRGREVVKVEVDWYRWYHHT